MADAGKPANRRSLSNFIDTCKEHAVKNQEHGKVSRSPGRARSDRRTGPGRSVNAARRLGLAAGFVACAVLGGITVAHAQDRRVADGVAVNIGWVSAAHAAQFEGESADHQQHMHKKGVFHMVVALSDANSGKPIGDAKVVAIMDDPLDRVQRRTLRKRETAGFPDFSGQFEFGAIGRYNITLEIAVAGRQSPLKVRFTRDYDGAS